MPGAESSNPDVDRRLEVALEAAAAAGEVTLHHFNRRSPGAIEVKGDGSPVTIADREAERTLREAIRRAFPEDGILGEEFGEIQGSSGYRWILDPIDGTKSFIRGVPLYGTLVAVERGGSPVAGIIHMPVLRETVFAAEGTGAWHRPAGFGREHEDVLPARVSQAGSFHAALLCTTSFSYAARHHEAEFSRLAADCGSIRGWSDCYAHLLVATGRADAAIEPMIQIWDVAPLVPILREAGGMYTDWAGAETHLSPTGLSSNGRIHEEILAVLRASTAGTD